MKGKIKYINIKKIDEDHFPKPKYIIEYYDRYCQEPRILFIFAEDMPEFMDEIYSQWLKLAPIKKITKQEEAEQDRDRREIDGETKTYNNFPTDEALDFDVRVRERT